MLRWFLLCIVIQAGIHATPCAAAEDEPLWLTYGLDGTGKGAALGATAGLMAVGVNAEANVWKNLAIGAGLGALSGLGTGIALAVLEEDRAPQAPRLGFYAFRDMGYGMTFGLLGGGLTGLIVWLAGGEGRDLVGGLGYGLLFGGGIGFIVGLIEAAMDRPKCLRDLLPKGKIKLDLGAAPGPGGSVMPTAMIRGRF